MKPLFLRAKICLLIGLLYANGCARYNDTNSSPPPPPYDPYAQINFEDLLNFSANMAGISASARSEICRTLLKTGKSSTDISVQLQLLIGRLFSEDCGDSRTILEAVAAIPPGNLRDERAQKLVNIHSEALKRLGSQQPRKSGVERKPKSAAAPLESKEKEAAGSKKDDARLLREKLEAIRSMEKQLDESGNDK